MKRGALSVQHPHFGTKPLRWRRARVVASLEAELRVAILEAIRSVASREATRRELAATDAEATP